MQDDDCVRFLQEVLPRLNLRWPGFRKVRGQVCKRLARRLVELGLPDLTAYRQVLADSPAEWEALDAMARISISRFYRDRRLFEVLADEVLPEIVRRAQAAGGAPVRLWSAGCASGEEPYTLALLWHFRGHDRAGLELAITATDVDPILLARARAGCYPESSLRELPRPWLAAFDRRDDACCLRPEFRTGIDFLQQDLRTEAPAGPFHLVACRNLAFTYFAEPLQREVLVRLAAALAPGGFLMIGGTESLPAGQKPFVPFQGRRGLYRKIDQDSLAKKPVYYNSGD